MIDWFEQENIGYGKFKEMNRKEFAKQFVEKCGNKKLIGKVVRLHKVIYLYEVTQMINVLENIDFGKLDKHKQTIIDWFHKDSIDKATFSVMNRK
eukprot:214161_1